MFTSESDCDGLDGLKDVIKDSYSLKELEYLAVKIENAMIKVDFLANLPNHLALTILGFLDDNRLGVCSQVTFDNLGIQDMV